MKGAIRIAASNKMPIKILGGSWINFKMGFRFSISPFAKFYGMVDGFLKFVLLNGSKALIFPVLWHEPFGSALIESLYFGCPVLGTKFGSLPEIVKEEVGFLANSEDELIAEFERIDSFDSKICHEYARDEFNSRKMAENYIKLYERILNDESINNSIPVFSEELNKLQVGNSLN